MNPRLPKLLLYLLGGLFVLNLIQAYFTELIFDEAYYWHYAKNMAWGYFDHPPMVAWMIRLSSLFFEGELGLRFVSCLMSVGTTVLLWMLVDDQRKKNYVPQFFVLVFSMTLLNAYGFFTLPDTPLLFFTALFLWVYKRFLNDRSLARALILGIVMACLIYSKYHAVLVIFFVLLSNLELFRDKYAWVAAGVSLLCYTPHFLWLYENDFVSIKYHLFERPNDAYNFSKYTLGFFINLVALFGLTFPWIYYSLFKTKASDKFTKALVFLTYGVILFFFISSFNRRVQTQWLIVISIPLAVLVFNFMLANENTRKWIYRTGIATVTVLMLLRIGLIYNPFPYKYETHGNKEWTQELKSQIGDIPVVFENSYRRAPMYSFYTGVDAFSLNNLFYRQNQYSLDGSESKVQHRKVLYVSEFKKSGEASYTQNNGKKIFGHYIDDFESFRKLKCIIDEKPFSPGSDKKVILKVYNPYNFDIDLKKIEFGFVYLDKYKKPAEIYPLNTARVKKKISVLKSNDTTKFTFKLPKTTFRLTRFRVGISENDLPYGLNGKTNRLD
ncbi:MAG: ArnT family glycosyltransferase [Aurantibacter sp.]